MSGIRNMVRNEKRLVIPTSKPRDLVARDLLTNGLYRPKQEKSIKAYNRKTKHKEYYGIE